MPKHAGTGRSRFGIPPITIITAAVAVGLAVVSAVTVLALRQPWLGVDFAVSPETGGVVARERGGGAELRGPIVLAAGGDALELEPVDVTIEPDGSMGSYEAYRRFLERQERLAEMLRADEVVLTDGAGVAVSWKPDPAGRPARSLPAEFWVQVAVGLVAWLVSAAVFAFRPREAGARYLLLSGAATLTFAPAAALYTTRELALPGVIFHWANDLNFLGGSLFAASLVALLFYYPRKIAPRWAGVAVVFVYLGWFAAQQAGVFENMTLARRLLVMAGVLATFALSGVQWILTRRDPVARAALQWFLLSWVLGSGAFAIFILLPQLFGIDTSPLQGYAFLLFLLVYVGLAFGILRYRLFELGGWWRRVVFWLAGVMLLVAFDLVFLLGLRLSSAEALGLALLICGMVWLPLRGWVWRQISRQRGLARQDLFSQVVDVALTPPGNADRDARWRKLVGSVFDPLAMETAESGAQMPLVAHDGSAMTLPAVAEVTAVRLEHAHGGRRLFGRDDAALAGEMVAMFRHASASRSAFEEGAARERGRIARDIHDNIGAHLLAALHSPTPAEKDERIRDAVGDLREVINDARRSEPSLDEALARLRLETADRLAADSIHLKWTSRSDDSPAPDRTWIPELRSVIREAISNVIRHSGARNVTISVRNSAGALALEIADDGCGFDPDAKPAGHGLANIRSRVIALGGSLKFKPGAAGTTLSAQFPIHRKPPEP